MNTEQTTHPLITIGITCFNAADTIARTIQSALNQDWPNTEIVIVDDYSRDKSCNIIEDYASHQENIKFISHKRNEGFPTALNTIIEHASGTFIAFFDDDDESLPQRLNQQYKRIRSYEKQHNTTKILCYTNRSVFIGGKEDPNAFVYAIGREEGHEPHGEMVSNYLLYHEQAKGYSWGQFGSCTLMTRKENFKQTGNFDPDFRRSAEWDLAVRMGFSGAHFIAVNEPLIKQYKTSTPDKAGTTPLRYALLLRKKHKNYLKKKNLYWASCALAYSRFYFARGLPWCSRAAMIAAFLFSPFNIFAHYLRQKFNDESQP